MKICMLMGRVTAAKLSSTKAGTQDRPGTAVGGPGRCRLVGAVHVEDEVLLLDEELLDEDGGEGEGVTTAVLSTVVVLLVAAAVEEDVETVHSTAPHTPLLLCAAPTADLT